MFKQFDLVKEQMSEALWANPHKCIALPSRNLRLENQQRSLSHSSVLHRTVCCSRDKWSLGITCVVTCGVDSNTIQLFYEEQAIIFVWCRDAGTAKAVVLVEEIRLQQSGLQKYYVRSDPKLTKILVGLHLFNLIRATITRKDCWNCVILLHMLFCLFTLLEISCKFKHLRVMKTLCLWKYCDLN